MISFKIFGINLAVSVGFVGLICLMLYVDRVGLMLPTILSVTLHETGHLIALLIFKSKPQRVEFKVGAVAIIGKFTLTSNQQFIMLFAGSSLNFFLFAALYCFYHFFKIPCFLNFSLVELVVGVLNLLPVMGLDGGEILNLVLLKLFKSRFANAVVFVVSVVTVLFIILFGFYVLNDTKSNISLIIFGIYLFLGILMSKKKKNDCNIYKNEVK